MKIFHGFFLFKNICPQCLQIKSIYLYLINHFKPNQTMSSFLHTAKHFNSIEKSLIELKTKEKSYCFCSNISVIEIEQVMKYFREFSCICVINQYKHHYDDPQKEIRLSHLALQLDESYLILKPIELYKAISSMEYQIEFSYLGREFSDSERIAVMKFNEIKLELCDLIISNLSEYQEVRTWSI